MRLVYAALFLLVSAGVAAIVGPVMEGRQRAPEATARAYLRAVEAGDVQAALAVIDPDQRAAQRERVELQVRNRYGIITLVLGQPSAVATLTGQASQTGQATAAAWVTVLADVTTVTGERWRSTSTAPLVQRDGVWYLSRPLFA